MVVCSTASHSSAVGRVGRNVNGVLLRTASSDLDRGDVSDLIVTKYGQGCGARCSRSSEGNVSGTVVDGGRAHDFVVTGQGGQGTVAVGGIKWRKLSE